MFRMVMLAVRTLWARPTRTLLTMGGVVLGVGVILAVSITNQSTLQSINNVFSSASGKAHLVVTHAESSEGGFSESALRKAGAHEGVAHAVPVVRGSVLLADEATPEEIGVSFFGAINAGILVYGVDPVADTAARDYEMVAGRFVAPELDAYEIVLVEDVAHDKEIEVGRDIDLATTYGIETVRVVGLMSKEGPGQLNNGSFGVMPIKAAQELFGRVGEIDQIDIVAHREWSSGGALDQVKAALQARMGKKFKVTYPASQGKRVTQMLGTYQMGLDMTSVIALFVGAFLIYNAFSMTVVERTREIGMLRTIGMTRRQVMRQILSEACILGILGSALGLLVGLGLSQGLIRAMEYILAQDVREIHVPVGGLTTSLVVGIGVTLMAALIPSWQAGRISPLEALRVRGDSREPWVVRRGWTVGLALIAFATLLLVGNVIPAEIQYALGSVAMFSMFLGATLALPITIGVWERGSRGGMQRLFGNEGRLGSGNIQRAKLRTTLTVAALMVGGAMILSMRGMMTSFEHDIRDWVDSYIGGDLYVHSNLPLRPDMGRRLESVEGVEAVAGIRYVDATWITPAGDEMAVTFTAVDPAQYARVTQYMFAANQGKEDALMEKIAHGDVIFCSSIMAETHGLQQGDTMRLETRRGRRDFEIGAIVIDYFNNGLVVEGSWKDLRRYFGINDVSAFLLKAKEGESLAVVEERIDALYGQRRHLTMESNQSLKSRALKLTAQTFSLFDVLAMISMIVASLGVVNTLTMNVLERTREIGMLRGMGMTRRQVRRMILAEAGVMGIIGGVLGLSLGLFMLYISLQGMASAQGYALTFVWPLSGIGITLAIALIVSQLAAVWPAKRAASVNIIEAIHTE